MLLPSVDICCGACRQHAPACGLYELLIPPGFPFASPEVGDVEDVLEVPGVGDKDFFVRLEGLE